MHAFLGYLLWQARACMCNVSSSHGHIIYLFTHLSLSPLERAHTAEVRLASNWAVSHYAELATHGSQLCHCRLAWALRLSALR